MKTSQLPFAFAGAADWDKPRSGAVAAGILACRIRRHLAARLQNEIQIMTSLRIRKHPAGFRRGAYSAERSRVIRQPGMAAATRRNARRLLFSTHQQQASHLSSLGWSSCFSVFLFHADKLTIRRAQPDSQSVGRGRAPPDPNGRAGNPCWRSSHSTCSKARTCRSCPARGRFVS